MRSINDRWKRSIEREGIVEAYIRGQSQVAAAKILNVSFYIYNSLFWNEIKKGSINYRELKRRVAADKSKKRYGLSKKKFIDLLKQCGSMKNVAKTTGINIGTLNYHLRVVYGDRNPYSLYIKAVRLKRKKETLRDFARLLNKYKKVSIVARAMKVSRQRIYQLIEQCEDNGVSICLRMEDIRTALSGKISRKELRWAVQNYRTKIDMAGRLKLSMNHLHILLNFYGLHGAFRRGVNKIPKSALLAAMRNREPMRSVARKFRVPYSRVSRMLEVYKVKENFHDARENILKEYDKLAKKMGRYPVAEELHRSHHEYWYQIIKHWGSVANFREVNNKYGVGEVKRGRPLLLNRIPGTPIK